MVTFTSTLVLHMCFFVNVHIYRQDNRDMPGIAVTTGTAAACSMAPKTYNGDCYQGRAVGSGVFASSRVSFGTHILLPEKSPKIAHSQCST